MMKEKIEVVALGELLIDMTDNGLSDQGNTLFEANPGGAPCNVLSMLSSLGHKTAFIGKVGDDIFGQKLKKILDKIGIDTSNLIFDSEHKTTLAFVETKNDGDRDFSFYRNPGADMMLTYKEINPQLLKNIKIFHFGTLSMTHEGVRSATKYAVETAKKNGALISFDPNIRKPLWKNLEEAREQTHYGLKMCDILKISDNEIRWLTNEEDFTEGVKKIRSQYQISLILVSMGKEGCRAYYIDENERELFAEIPAFVQKDTIETTGAGDTFMGCVLHYLLQKNIKCLDKKDLIAILTFANAAASIITTKKGALRVMPGEEEIKELVEKTIIKNN